MDKATSGLLLVNFDDIMKEFMARIPHDDGVRLKQADYWYDISKGQVAVRVVYEPIPGAIPAPTSIQQNLPGHRGRR